jgi:hypothetical protein
MTITRQNPVLSPQARSSAHAAREIFATAAARYCAAEVSSPEAEVFTTELTSIQARWARALIAESTAIEPNTPAWRAVGRGYLSLIEAGVDLASFGSCRRRANDLGGAIWRPVEAAVRAELLRRHAHAGRCARLGYWVEPGNPTDRTAADHQALVEMAWPFTWHAVARCEAALATQTPEAWGLAGQAIRAAIRNEWAIDVFAQQAERAAEAAKAEADPYCDICGGYGVMDLAEQDGPDCDRSLSGFSPCTCRSAQ